MSINLESITSFGQRHADLYIGFCHFIHHQALEAGVDRVFFCTREGEFLKLLYDTLFHLQNQSENSPQSQLLEISRLAVFGPSLQQLNRTSLMRLWNQYSAQSPQALMMSLGLNFEDVASVFAKNGLAKDSIVNEPWNDSRLNAVLEDAEFQESVKSSLSQRRRLARDYLDDKFGADKRVAIVDIGWRGSTQDSVAKMYPDRSFHCFYLGIARFFNEQPENVVKRAFGPNSNQSMKNFSLLHAVDVIEMLTNSPNGSVVDYRLNDAGTITPVRQNDESEDRAYAQFAGEFQKAILKQAAVADAKQLHRDYQNGSLQESAMVAWHNILEEPCDDLVTTYFQLNHNEEFGTGEFKNKSAVPGVVEIICAPFSRAGFGQLKKFATYNQWVPGLRRRKDLTFMNRFVLVSLVRSGLVYKWIKARFTL